MASIPSLTPDPHAVCDEDEAYLPGRPHEVGKDSHDVNSTLLSKEPGSLDASGLPKWDNRLTPQGTAQWVAKCQSDSSDDDAIGTNHDGSAIFETRAARGTRPQQNESHDNFNEALQDEHGQRRHLRVEAYLDTEKHAGLREIDHDEAPGNDSLSVPPVRAQSLEGGTGVDLRLPDDCTPVRSESIEQVDPVPSERHRPPALFMPVSPALVQPRRWSWMPTKTSKPESPPSGKERRWSWFSKSWVHNDNSWRSPGIYTDQTEPRSSRIPSLNSDTAKRTSSAGTPKPVEKACTIKTIFDEVGAILTSQQEEDNMKEWENLFISITGSRDSSINVSADVSAILLRLGISDLRLLRETTHKVCQSRGREPDAWHGTGVSLKVPEYHQLDCEEFMEVMAILTKSGVGDEYMKARQIFLKFDRDNIGLISSKHFFDTIAEMQIEMADGFDFAELFKKTPLILDEPLGTGQSFSDETETLDYKKFLTIMGLDAKFVQSSNMEAADLRRRIQEALTTFHLFDEDGSGTIDVMEIKRTMLAYGQKVSEDEARRMLAVADENHTGEIDFERFCYAVLNVTQSEFKLWIQEHLQRPIEVENAVGRKSLDLLCASALHRDFPVSFDGSFTRIRSTGSFTRSEPSIYVPQDLGQYGQIASNYSHLDDANNDDFLRQMTKRALSRPISLPVLRTPNFVTCAAFCPSGLKVAVTSSDGNLRLYDLRRPNANLLCQINAHDHMAMCLAWLPDGSGIVTGGADWTVSMWSGEDLSFLGSEMPHFGYVRCLATSHDCTRVVSGSSDLNINIYSTVPFKCENTVLEGHTSWVRWLHFSHDNIRLISGGDDQSIIIWDMLTLVPMQTLRAHSHTVAAGVSLTNNKLYSGGFDDNLLLWSQDTGLLGYLKVFVAEAFDLPRGGFSGVMSNQRFVKIELGKGQQAETKLKSGTMPQWYEEFDMNVWNVDERVHIEVYDWDKDLQHRFLGSVFVPIQELIFADDGITDREYDLLNEEGDPSNSSVSLRFTFREVQCTGELTVNIERARGLPRMDTFGSADPFVSITCGKGTRYKTKVIKNTLNPTWNEEFIYNVEDSARELKMVLYDWSLTKEEDFIGQIVIPTSEIEAHPFQDEWFKLKALNGTDDAKGELKVKIRFLPEAQRDSKAIRFRRNPASWPVGEKADFSHYAPVGQVKFFGRIFLRGKCKYCNKRRDEHAKNLRCELGTGNYFHSLAVNKAQSILACGTGDGRIRVSMIATGQQIACWTAHAGPVLGLQFANGDDRLMSWGADCRVVDAKDFFFGSYMPSDSKTNDTGKRNCVEVWYVASMMRALDNFRQRGIETTESDDGHHSEDSDDSEKSDEEMDFNLSDDDEDDKTLTDEEKESRKKRREAQMAKMALNRKGRRGKGQGALLGARVGFTPVYYPPPRLPDGNLARSCLKGRGRQNVQRANLSWDNVDKGAIEIHYYPPENPNEDGEEDIADLSAKPKVEPKEDAEAREKKKRLAEEKRRERAKARQEAKDRELFGRPVNSNHAVSKTISPTPSEDSEPSPVKSSREDLMGTSTPPNTKPESESGYARASPRESPAKESKKKTGKAKARSQSSGNPQDEETPAKSKGEENPAKSKTKKTKDEGKPGKSKKSKESSPSSSLTAESSHLSSRNLPADIPESKGKKASKSKTP